MENNKYTPLKPTTNEKKETSTATRSNQNEKNHEQQDNTARNNDQEITTCDYIFGGLYAFFSFVSDKLSGNNPSLKQHDLNLGS